MDATPRLPPGTAEVGLDIIRVDRIREALERFGERFVDRVLTPAEARYVRGRPQTFAGRWAAKEAVSKVLGLGRARRSAGATSRSSACPPASRRCASTGGRPAGPTSSAWSASR